jgi:hypothetical protein
MEEFIALRNETKEPILDRDLGRINKSNKDDTCRRRKPQKRVHVKEEV